MADIRNVLFDGSEILVALKEGWRNKEGTSR